MQKEETRKERFRRVVSRRTENILEDLRILGNCSNKSMYDYIDEDVAKVFGTIEEQLRAVKARFKTVRKKRKFKL
ncbi:MAG TPA: hypothetical protein VJC15_01080 [Candidatus Paceibacterota bacterium]